MNDNGFEENNNSGISSNPNVNKSNSNAKGNSNSMGDKLAKARNNGRFSRGLNGVNNAVQRTNNVKNGVEDVANDPAGVATEATKNALGNVASKAKSSAETAVKGAVRKGAATLLFNPIFWVVVGVIVVILMVVIFSGAILSIFGDGSNGSSGGSVASSSSECGFTISSTSLSKSEFVSSVTDYADSHSSMCVFGTYAGEIYDLSLSYGVNPELVVVRGAVEGLSRQNNYWGIGCTNNGGISACKSYSTFMDGVEAFLKIASKYSSLVDMMTSYAYIGKYWYNPGASDLGGCYYASYIYGDDMPSRVKNACNGAKCTGSEAACVKTTDEEQEAYTKWQIEKNMSGVREDIFGLSSSEGVSCTTGVDDVEISELINLSQEEAWEVLIGKKTSEKAPSVSQSTMDQRVTTIEVPIRVWKSGSGSDPETDTTKSTAKITVNSALADLWLAFFTDVYNEATDFVIASMDGCYVYRTVTGGNSLSAHAYGVACDINALTTGNGYKTTSYSKETWEALPESRAKYQVIYKGSKVVEIAHRYTLINGSDWSNANDSMHFSFIVDWTRAQAQSCQGKVTC